MCRFTACARSVLPRYLFKCPKKIYFLCAIFVDSNIHNIIGIQSYSSFQQGQGYSPLSGEFSFALTPDRSPTPSPSAVSVISLCFNLWRPERDL